LNNTQLKPEKGMKLRPLFLTTNNNNNMEIKYSSRLTKIFEHSVKTEMEALSLVDLPIDQDIVYSIKKNQENIGMLVRDILDDLRKDAMEQDL
jgi:hypothetical protein